MSESQRVRVLVVDDSAVIRRWLQVGLDRHDGIDVVGTAACAFEAYDSIFELCPDVLTLDVQMPRMDGLTFLGKLMRHHPMPVIIHSSVTPLNSVDAVTALSLGAIDVVPKETSGASQEATLAKLATSIRAAARARPRSLKQPLEGGTSARNGAEPRATRVRSLKEHQEQEIAAGNVTAARPTWVRAIGIAASTGGPRAVESILRRIPADFPCILLVQHLPDYFIQPFADRLDAASPARVRVARGDEVLSRGQVLVAPGNRHLSLGSDPPRTRLSSGPTVNFHRPSADVLFRAMARTLGSASIGVILTGMGKDGAAGLLEMFRTGAHTIAEAEASCAVYGMPRAAVEQGGVTEVSDLDEVVPRLSLAVEGEAIQVCGRGLAD